MRELCGEPKQANKPDLSARFAVAAAFDLAWAEIEAAGGGYDVQTARNLLAKLIVEAALTGERDLARLKAYALEGFDP